MQAQAIAPPPGLFGRRLGALPLKPTTNEAPPRPAERDASGPAAPVMNPDAVAIGAPVLRGEVMQPEQGAPRGIFGNPRQGPLGGSMRQPFDYQAMYEKLAGKEFKPKWWQVGLAALGDALAQQGGGRGYAMQSLTSRRDASLARIQDAVKTLAGWQHQDWARQNEADLSAAAPFTIGRDRLTYDPATGQVANIYHGPQDFELYAQQMGLEPGSEEYFKAVEDYVLRSAGPSAFERNKQLDDYRTGNDASLESLRYGNRVGLEDLRQSHRQGLVDYRNSHPAPSRARGAKGSARPTATDGHGNKVEWNGKAWVPAH